MAERFSSDKVVTPVFVASYPYLFRPQPNNLSPGGDPSYSVVMLFPKDADLGPLKRAVKDVMALRFGEDQKKWPKVKLPFRDQGEKEGSPGYEPGALFATAKSKSAPQIVDRNNQEIIDEDEIYPGVMLKASVNAFFYDVNGNKGVSFGLRNVKKVKDGPRIGGRATAASDFADDLPEAGDKDDLDDIF